MVVISIFSSLVEAVYKSARSPISLNSDSIIETPKYLKRDFPKKEEMMSMSSRKKIKISVLTISNKVLTFNVDKYEVIDGFVCFIDIYPKTNIRKPKKFPVARTEISEEVLDDS